MSLTLQPTSQFSSHCTSGSLLVVVRTQEQQDRVKRIQNILWVHLLCTFFALALGIEYVRSCKRSPASSVYEVDQTEWHLVAPILFRKLSQHRFVDTQKGHAVTVLFCARAPLKTGGILAFQNG